MTSAHRHETLPQDSMLLSEERLHVGSEWVDVQRVVARRRIVSRVIQIDVTVRREELFFDQEPLTPTVSELPLAYVPPLVVVLHEEVPVVSLAVQAYEQATISIVQVDGAQQIDTTLDSEQIDLQAEQQILSP